MADDLPARRDPALLRLARLHHVQTGYWGLTGRRHEATQDALVAVLRALGAPVSTAGDAGDAVRQRRAAVLRRVVPPVTVAFQGEPPSALVTVQGVPPGRLHADLTLEDGRSRALSWDLHEPERSVSEDGAWFSTFRLPLPADLPAGYHDLAVAVPAREAGPQSNARSRLIVAPAGCAPGPARAWGAFLPVHAMRTSQTWGVGDLGSLGALLRWAGAHGASVVGALPLLPAFLDAPFDPSPYAPVSRLFWNPLYIDPARAPGLDQCADARGMLSSGGVQAERAALEAAPLVDYRRAMALKRRVLEALAACDANASGIAAFAASHPEVTAYARFMAATEALGTWQAWPAAMREGQRELGGNAGPSWRYHVYAQWAAHEQMAALRQGGAGLYQDFPLGVHRDGFDVWRHQDRFALAASVGAPPDPLGPLGQDWGFPPLHPELSREDGHRYWTASIRHHMRSASMLRLDHAMGLHRQYWIPRGGSAASGVYVRYPARDLYAILAIESHRHGCAVVGEDLGTVPGYVRTTMKRRGLHRMYVLQFELIADGARPVHPVPSGAVASLGTHDTPTFAAFLRGDDIALRERLGQLDMTAAQGEREARRRSRDALGAWLHAQHGGSVQHGDRPLLRDALRTLAESDAALVLVNLEDLWGETEPHNVPGTGAEQRNWRRRASRPLEVFMDAPDILASLSDVDASRCGGSGR